MEVGSSFRGGCKLEVERPQHSLRGNRTNGLGLAVGTSMNSLSDGRLGLLWCSEYIFQSCCCCTPRNLEVMKSSHESARLVSK